MGQSARERFRSCEPALSNMTPYLAPSYRTIRVHYELHRMITATSINQIPELVVNCDFVGLRRALHDGHKHRSQDYQKRQQPKKSFHGFHSGKRVLKGGRMASHDAALETAIPSASENAPEGDKLTGFLKWESAIRKIALTLYLALAESRAR